MNPKKLRTHNTNGFENIWMFDLQRGHEELGYQSSQS